MSLTPSNMLPLETTAPDFQLLEPKTGQMRSLEELASDKATVIMFICNHCPYVIHVLPELRRLTEEYSRKGVSFVAINANDIEHYPDDAPDKMVELLEEWHLNIPYLYDETQAVAKAYDAACTPDFYVFDKDLKLAYRGRLDDARPGNDAPLTGEDLRAALDAVLEGKPVSIAQIPSMGCNIKWKRY